MVVLQKMHALFFGKIYLTATKAGEYTIECWIPVLEYSKVELPPANKDKY